MENVTFVFNRLSVNFYSTLHCLFHVTFKKLYVICLLHKQDVISALLSLRQSQIKNKMLVFKSLLACSRRLNPWIKNALFQSFFSYGKVLMKRDTSMSFIFHVIFPSVPISVRAYAAQATTLVSLIILKHSLFRNQFQN